MASSKLGLRRFRNGEDVQEQARLRLEASRIVFRQGDLLEARRLALEAIRIVPRYADAWLQLAWYAQGREERVALLRQVLAIAPGHAQALAELARLERAAAARKPTSRGRIRVQYWVLALAILAMGTLLVVLLAWGPVESSLAWLIATPTPTAAPSPTQTPGEIAARFVPQLQVALSGGDWDRAVELVDIMVGVDPVGEEVRQWALTTHMQYGQALAQAGVADLALAQFDQAVALAPDDEQVGRWQQMARVYLAGRTALQSGDWDVAIQSFTLVREQMPDYGDVVARQAEAYFGQGQAAVESQDWTTAIESLTEAHEGAPEDSRVTDLLSLSYRQRGIAWQEQDAMQEARADLEAALALRPDDEQARTHLDEVMYILFPPKRIEIDITEQRFYAWEGDTLVYDLPTSTGLPGRDTATGNFEVLDKMPMAYSSIWKLSMPYWLGIYYVGNIENGIHALPIRPDGTVMWGGLLGQKASYGCVILSTEAAQIIYDWAEIGTSVQIHN